MDDFVYPTPTPYPELDATPLPTLESAGAREIAVETIQWWNQGDAVGITEPLQIMALVAIIVFGIAIISQQLKRSDD